MKFLNLIIMCSFLTACQDSGTSVTEQSASTKRRVIITSKKLSEIKKQVGPSVADVSSTQASFELTSGQIKQLESNNQVEKIEEDVVFSLPPIKELRRPSGGGTTQPNQVIPWGITTVGALNVSSKGSGVKVCVVDTGLDVSHPDFNPNKVKALGVPGLRNKASDDNGHGTHVGGTIAAQNNSIGVVGVAPEVELISVKALNRQGSGYSSDLANAIDVCISQGVQVINASWGSASYSSVIAAAVSRATAQGIYFVAAAGNEATSVGYPAALSDAVAISAIDQNYNLASFSNFGLEIDYTAPGVGILSTLPGGKYASWSGTSMATPHAVGIIALMISSGQSVIPSVDVGLPLSYQGQGMVSTQGLSQ